MKPVSFTTVPHVNRNASANPDTHGASTAPYTPITEKLFEMTDAEFEKVWAPIRERAHRHDFAALDMAMEHGYEADSEGQDLHPQGTAANRPAYAER